MKKPLQSFEQSSNDATEIQFDAGHRSTEFDYLFECPECGMSPVVNERVRQEMLSTGCFLCDAPVSRSDFRVL